MTTKLRRQKGTEMHEQTRERLDNIGSRDHSITAEYRIFGPPGTGKLSYFAEFRLLLRERSDCHTALMRILDVFVRVGWPSAYQLTYQLSNIYR